MKTRILSVIFLVGLLLSGGLCMTSCDNDEISTNQYVGGISLNVFGPSPVLRGGELRFLGSGMDRVAAVVFPGGSEVTEITVVSDTEIRVTVPQDAQPGQVVLKTPDGDITTKTELTYLEPVSIESFSPASVRPGDELTITGEYLNLMHAVVFTDEVTVLEENFIEHTRQTIRLIVPKEARSGRIAVSDTASVMPNIMYAEGELTVALPSVPEVVTKTDAKVGEEIEIVGQDLDQIKEIRMSNGETIGFECVEIENPGVQPAEAASRADEALASGKWFRLTFVIPEHASNGDVVMVTYSGVEITILVLQLALPEVTAGVSPFKPGADLTLLGTNLDAVVKVSLPGVDEAVEPSKASADTLVVTTPATATGGNLYLLTAGNDSIAVPVVTVKPAMGSFGEDPVQAGAEVTFTGTDLDLVAAVMFGSARAEVRDVQEGSLKVTVPTSVSAGNVDVTLEMINGETVKCERQLTVSEPEGCTIVNAESLSATAGGTLVVAVKNADLLTKVTLNGNDVTYAVEGDKLTVNIPANVSGPVTLNLISGEVEVYYSVNVEGSGETPEPTPDPEPGVDPTPDPDPTPEPEPDPEPGPGPSAEETLWEGSVSTGVWANGMQDLAWGNVEVWDGVKAGQVLTVYFNQEPVEDSYWQISLGQAGNSWNDLPGWGNAANGGNLEAGTQTSFSYTLTAEDVVALQEYGLVVKGRGIVITKVTVK